MKLVAITIIFFTTFSYSIAQPYNSCYLENFKAQLKLKWPNNKTINVVFHGHSVPAGYFKAGRVNTQAAYPQLFLKFINKRYPFAVVNSIVTAIGGENSEQGAERFKSDVLAKKPDLLFIDYALNDRYINIETSENSWRSMIEQALKAEVKTILLTPTPDLNENILDENALLAIYMRMIKRLGKEYEIPVIDSYSAFKHLKENGIDISKYMSQGNHPNKLGHNVVLDEIVKNLFKEYYEE